MTYPNIEKIAYQKKYLRGCYKTDSSFPPRRLGSYFLTLVPTPWMRVAMPVAQRGGKHCIGGEARAKSLTDLTAQGSSLRELHSVHAMCSGGQVFG